MRFTLTQTRQPWEAQPPLDAESVMLAIKSQLDRDSPMYDERLASYVESVTVESPFEFSIRFSRVPARIEPVLRDSSEAVSSDVLPVEPANAAIEKVAFIDSSAAQSKFTGGFPVVSSNEKETIYRRLRVEPDGLPQYHVAEIIEQRYDSHEKAYQGLIHGEVWMLPDLPDWIVRRAQTDRTLEKDFFIQKYAVPTTHVLQFNPKSRPLAFRELRRALLQAIDRDKLLNEIVLRDKVLIADLAERDKLLKERGADDKRVKELDKTIRERRQAAHARVVNSPFPSFSYANSPNLLPQGLDLSSAVAMSIAVTNQMGGQIPPLRLAVPPEPIPQAIATKLLTAWRRVGIQVVPVEAGSADAAGWDIAYRTVQITEPIVELWPFLTVQDRAYIEDLAPFPDWLRQELISLDRTVDWNHAVELIQTLHRHLWADVRMIPLWEVDGYIIYRKQLRGVPTEPLHCYEQIDRWNQEAWYATETP
jgi:ABC-type transport system substrate-binding protein